MQTPSCFLRPARLASHRPEMTFAPLSRCRNYPLSWQASTSFTRISYIPPQGGVAGQSGETAAKICPSGSAQGRGEASIPSSLARLITISQCLTYSHHHWRSFPDFPFSPFSLNRFPRVPYTPTRLLLVFPSLLSLSLSVSATAADEAMHVHTQSFSRDHWQIR